MSYIGKTPTSVPLTSSDITDGIISTSKIANDAITSAKLGTGDMAFPNGNLVFETASKGIYLGVTSATAANLLDDFEEGNHAAAFTTSSGSITISRNDLFYTKIGRQVTLTGEIDIGSVSSPVSPRLSLPFVIANQTVDRNMNFAAFIQTYNVAFNGDNQAVCLNGSSGNSYVSFTYQTNNGAFGAYTAAAGDIFFMNFTYFTN